MNSMNNQQQPFKVFQTREDWQAAVNEIVSACIQELNGRNAQTPGTEEAASGNASGAAQESGERGYDQRVEAVRSQLAKEEEELKKEFPDFDLKEMMQSDPEFRNRILKGYSVEEAFYLSNRMNGRSRAAEEKPRGIRENGVLGTGGGTVSADASTMSDKDFKAYIQNIIGGRL